jgi:hypothetical protein
MFIYVCCMTDENIPGIPTSTNITPEMRLLFLSLGVDKVKCQECNRSAEIQAMEWENENMWFICITCKKINT